MDIRRGVIRAFDNGTYLADVQIVGSMATMLTGVPVAKQIGADLLTSGTKCGVLFFDEPNPSDACVVFVYDGAPPAWITSALIKDGEVAEDDLAFDPLTPTEHDARDHSAVVGTVALSELGSKAHSELTGVGADDHHAHPCARVYHSAAQSIADSTWVALAFNSERFDNDAIHDTVTNNSRLTCKTAGKYQISGAIQFDSNGTGNRGIKIRLDGSTDIALHQQGNTGADYDALAISTLYELAVNEYVELMVLQKSGGNLDVVAGGGFSPEFMMVKVG